MQILRAKNYSRTAWKNGGGETAEIAVYPPGAGLNDFGWRISLASVSSDGPFSIFPGVDRTLAVLDGQGMDLQIAGHPTQRQTPATAPLAFSGDLAVVATLVDGPVQDLNVMSARASFSHDMDFERIDGVIQHKVLAQSTLFFCVHGYLDVSINGQWHQLCAQDSLLIQSKILDFSIQILRGNASIYKIQIHSAKIDY